MTVHRSRKPRPFRTPPAGGCTAVAVAVGMSAVLAPATASADPGERDDIDWHRRIVALNAGAAAPSPTQARPAPGVRTRQEAAVRRSASANAEWCVWQGPDAANWQRLRSRTGPRDQPDLRRDRHLHDDSADAVRTR